MKIALIGYGRMGHIIEEVAVSRGHSIVCTIDEGDDCKFDSPQFKAADVAIEFSIPSAAVGNIKKSFAAGVPVVSGTTGWLDSLPEIENMCISGDATLLYASNFSIGVNLFRAFNRYMTKVMDVFGQYRAELTETHHIHKLDHPSGTAVTVADDMVGCSARIDAWKESETPVASNVLNVRYRRQDEVPGIHTVQWIGTDDSISLTHSARSRRGFALGAVMAAEWVVGRPHALYSVNDMLADITATDGIFK